MSEELVVKPQVALFIDLENIRYGYFNQFQSEPDLRSLMTIARSEGPVAMALAYADFQRHPDHVRRELDAMGVSIRDVPLRQYQTPDGTRVKNSVDYMMMLDILETALDKDKVLTFVIATGDSDFQRVVTMAQNRFEKRVVVVGVNGTLSGDLAAAATEVIRLNKVAVATDSPIVAAVIRLMREHVPPTGFWTIPQLIRWSQQPHNGVPGSNAEQSAIIGMMIEQGMIKQEVLPAEGTWTERKVSSVNEDHPLVRQILGLEPLVSEETEDNEDDEEDEDNLGDWGIHTH